MSQDPKGHHNFSPSQRGPAPDSHTRHLTFEIGEFPENRGPLCRTRIITEHSCLHLGPPIYSDWHIFTA